MSSTAGALSPDDSGDLTGAPLSARTLEDAIADAERPPTGPPPANADQLENEGIAENSLASLLRAVERLARAASFNSQAESQQSFGNELERAAELIASTEQLAEALNFLGDIKNPRTSEAACELIHPAVMHIKARAQAKESVLPGELRLHNCFVWSRSPLARQASWQKLGSALFDMQGRSENLPGPNKYLALAVELPAPANALISSYAEIEQQIATEKKQRSTPEVVERLRELRDEKAVLEERLDKLLSPKCFGDPHKIPEVGLSVNVRVGAKRDVFKGLIETYHGLSALIEQAVLPTKDLTPEAFQRVVRLPELVQVPNEKGGTKFVFQTKEVPLPTGSQDSEDRSDIIALLECFLATRKALESLYPGIPTAQKGPDPELRAFREEVEGTLGPLFGKRTERTAEVIEAIARLQDPRMPELLGKLVAIPILISKEQRFEVTLARPENFRLFTLGTGLLISGSDSVRASLERVFQSAQLTATVDFIRRVREVLGSKKNVRIARLFDDELDRISKDTSGGFQAKAALFAALRGVVDDPRVRRGLKGRLKNIRTIDDLAAKTQSALQGEKSNAARAIESVRREIFQKLSPNLNDYYGQRKLVAEIREVIDNNLSLLASPESWEGTPAHFVIINGFLFHGGPGAGKTYLAKCIANEYGLPLITVTREEMAVAFKRASAAAARAEKNFEKPRSPADEGAVNALETALAEFMENKIRHASDEMKKSGASAAIVFIDEMEAEFQNRDPLTSNRDDITRTNIMLRVIERLIEEHSEVFFMSATNHFKQVDSAGLRLGRYGVHFHIALPMKEDAEDLIKGIFANLDISISAEHEKSDGYKKLVESAVGVPPKLTAIGINNKIALLRLRAKGREEVINDETFAELAKGIKFLIDHDHRGRTFDTNGKKDAIPAAEG